MRACCALLVVVLAVARVPLAVAQEFEPAKVQAPAATPEDGEPLQAEAKRTFEQGKLAFEAGRFEEAAERFERAYLLSGRAELLFNVGIAADRLRDDGRALQAFERFLALDPNSELRGQVERRVAALRAARERRATADREPAPAPSPEQVARAQAARSSAATAPTRAQAADRDSEGGLLSEWWFWTAAGVVIAGGAVSAYLLTREDDVAELPPPNTGVVIPTLRLAP